ncbi:MAG: DUF2059 domain-containing protein [Acidobacteriota bacterium]
MRRLLVCLLMTALTAAAQATKDQKIEQILQLTGSDSVVNVVSAQMQEMMAPLATTPQQKARTKEAVDKIVKLVKTRVEKIRPQMVKFYSENFTAEEIDGLLAFYESPPGRASLQKLPVINAKMSELIQSELNAIGPEINKIAEDALKK